MLIVGQGALHARAIKFCEANGIDSDDVAFSINNPHILTDAELAGKRWYNVHAGLTAHYRGVGEICVFKAVCEDDMAYGVTLHRILPCQRVDAGPIVAQVAFPVFEWTFEKLMGHALNACQMVFEQNVRRIITEDIPIPRGQKVAYHSLSYRDLPRLIENTPADRLERACHLGKYAGYLPKMVDVLNEYA